MNIFALQSLLTSIIALFLGNFVLYLDKKNILNRLYFIISISIACWGFTEFMARISTSKAAAYFWIKLAFHWPIIGAVLMYFVLVFVEKTKSTKHKILFYFTIILSVIITYIDCTTNLLVSEVRKEYWGYTYTFTESWTYIPLTSWLIIVGFFVPYICIDSFLKAKNPLKKKQAKYITIGLSQLFISGLIEGIFVHFEIKIPNPTSIATLLLASFIGYAIWKYRLFVLDPTMAAENIISTMTEALFLADTNSNIIVANNAATDISGYGTGELTKMKLTSLIHTDELINAEHASNKKTELKTKAAGNILF